MRERRLQRYRQSLRRREERETQKERQRAAASNDGLIEEQESVCGDLYHEFLGAYDIEDEHGTEHAHGHDGKGLLVHGELKNCWYVFSLLLMLLRVRACAYSVYMHAYTYLWASRSPDDSTVPTVFGLNEALFRAISSHLQKTKAASCQNNRLCNADASKIEYSYASCSRAAFRISPSDTKWGGRAVGTTQTRCNVSRLFRPCCRTLGPASGVSIWLD